jgi:hypothetical protein
LSRRSRSPKIEGDGSDSFVALDFFKGGPIFMIKDKKEKVMIEITITETAKIELFKVLRDFDAQSIRLIRQGYG